MTALILGLVIFALLLIVARCVMIRDEIRRCHRREGRRDAEVEMELWEQ